MYATFNVLGVDLNGHVGEGNIGNEEIMGRYGAGTRNKKESMVVDFAKRIDLAIVNTFQNDFQNDCQEER